MRPSAMRTARYAKIQLLPHHPVVDVLARLVLCDAIAFLNLAFELLTLAGDFVEIIVREMAPLLLDLAFELLPVSFNAIPIHYGLLMVKVRQRLNAASSLIP